MNYFITFFTHNGAIKFSKLLKEKNIIHNICPVPRKISSSCGIGVNFTYNDDIDFLYTKDIDKIYTISSNKYILYRDYD